MPSAVRKVLGQAAPAAATPADVYTVPAGKEAVVSTITAAEYNGSATTIRISVRPDGATAANQHRIAWNVALGANQTIAFTIGLTLDAADVITVESASGNVAFNVFGQEITP